MTLTQEAIGLRLKEARENIRLTQEEAAQTVTLDRTALVKIEKGIRAVTSTELMRLARLYRRDLSELLTETPLQEDPFTILGRIAENDAPDTQGPVATALEQLKEAVRLEGFLGGSLRPHPPTYQFDAPHNYEEAIEQGKEVAILERRRLSLGDNALPDAAQIIAKQGIWTAAVPLPEKTSGLFVAHPRYGLAIFVNQSHRRARRRFSYAHEYAHALLDRGRSTEPTTADNAKTFSEKRANAFASEFLMPADGVTEALERMRKGGSSRTSSWTYDVFSDFYVHDEARNDASAVRISVHDVAFLAHEFRVSYEMAAIRLKDLDCIRKSTLDILLEAKEAGRDFMRALNLYDPDDDETQPYLEWQLVGLAMEAFRRDKISRGRFVSVCKLCDKDPERMLAIALSEKKD